MNKILKIAAVFVLGIGVLTGCTDKVAQKITNDTETKQIVLKKEPSHKAASYKATNDKHRKHKKSNQAVTAHKIETISKQRTPQGGNGYEKNRNTNKRRRRTWNERRHKSAN